MLEDMIANTNSLASLYLNRSLIPRYTVPCLDAFSATLASSFVLYYPSLQKVKLFSDSKMVKQRFDIIKDHKNIAKNTVCHRPGLSYLNS